MKSCGDSPTVCPSKNWFFNSDTNYIPYHELHLRLFILDNICRITFFYKPISTHKAVPNQTQFTYKVCHSKPNFLIVPRYTQEKYSFNRLLRRQPTQRQTEDGLMIWKQGMQVPKERACHLKICKSVHCESMIS